MTDISRAVVARVRARPKVDFKTKAATSGAVFAVMSLLGLGYSVSALNPVDEAWFVQVIARMREGDILYRDISYGAGPLPAYLTEAMTYLVGVDVLAEKLVVVLAFAATATLAWAVAAHVGLAMKERLLVLAGVSYFSPPIQAPPYGSLATTFVVAALLAALVFRTAETPRGRTAASVAGGAACGLAFVCKQNVGGYALVAFVFVLLIDRSLRNACLAICTGVASVVLVIVPVFLTGGLKQYVDYGFTGKGDYVHSRAKFGSVWDVLETIGNTHSSATAQAAYWKAAFFLPYIALAGLVALGIVVRSRRSSAVLPLVVFAAAASATLFPRFDTTHVTYAGALLVPPLAYLFHLWRAHLPRPFWIAVSLWLGVGIASMATLPLRLMHSPNANLSELAHLRGAFVYPDDVARWERQAAQLKVAARGDSDGLLLLFPDAGFRYLTTGLQNPTAFDYPFVTTFGRDGQADVIAALRSGRISRVCMTDDWFGLPPQRVLNYVRSTMQRGTRLGLCTVYAQTGWSAYASVREILARRGRRPS